MKNISIFISLCLFRFITKTLSLCDSGWVEEAPLCYKVHNEYRTFRDAINLCNKDEADLIMPTTKSENAIIGNLGNQEAWIGLRNTSFDTTIGEYNYEWIDGSSLIYSNWRYSVDREYPCVIIHHAGNNKWRGTACNQENQVICQKKKTVTDCPTNWYRSFSRKVCYRQGGSGTITDAIQQCSFIDNIAADVAMPISQQRNGILNFLMKMYLLSSIHIGLESTHQNEWTWFTGEKLLDRNFSAWISGNPFPATGQYVTMANKKWTNHGDSTIISSIICQCNLLQANQTPVLGTAYCTLPGTLNSVPFTQETIHMHETTCKHKRTYSSLQSTGQATTVSYVGTSSSITSQTSSCFQECPCNPNSVADAAFASAELDRRIQDIKANLTVEKSSLSKTIRKLTCAEDPRVSSKYIGYFGAVMILVVFALVVCIDCFSIATFRCRS